MQKKFTVIVPTYNEEARIRRVIANYSHYANLIVLDNYSTDKTRDICHELGVTVILTKNDGSLSRDQLKLGIEHASTDWVLLAICSEITPHELLMKLNEVALEGNDEIRGVRFYRRSYTGGIPTHSHEFNYWRTKKKFTGNVRFFNKNFWDWQNSKIHCETPIIGGPKNILSLPVRPEYIQIHLRDMDLNATEEKHSRYAELEAQQKHDAGVKGSYIRLIILPLYFACFMTLKNLRGGYMGILTSLYHSIYIFQVEARLIMHENGANLSTIVENNNKLANKIISKCSGN